MTNIQRGCVTNFYGIVWVLGATLLYHCGAYLMVFKSVDGWYASWTLPFCMMFLLTFYCILWFFYCHFVAFCLTFCLFKQQCR